MCICICYDKIGKTGQNVRMKKETPKMINTASLEQVQNLLEKGQN